MKIIKKSPDPFFYSGTKKVGILLIHGFTGSPSEMKLLGDFLNKHGYTVYAPLLAGHGETPEAMNITNKDDWWGSVLEGYDFLAKKGYEEIVAVGLSMGGLLSLKLAMHKPLKAVVAMAAPIYVHDRRIGLARWLKYIKAYKLKKSKDDHISEYLASYDRTPIACVESLYRLIKEVRSNLRQVTIPIQVMQGERDETVSAKSASYIYEQVASGKKELLWYSKSSHIMTLDKERKQIYEDILSFLDKLDKKK